MPLCKLPSDALRLRSRRNSFLPPGACQAVLQGTPHGMISDVKLGATIRLLAHHLTLVQDLSPGGILGFGGWPPRLRLPQPHNPKKSSHGDLNGKSSNPVTAVQGNFISLWIVAAFGDPPDVYRGL